MLALLLTALAPAAAWAQIANDDFYSMPQNTTLIVPPPGVLDNDPLLFKVRSFNPPVKGTLTFNPEGNGAFTYTPAPGDVGPIEFFYEAEDILGLASDSAKVTILVVADAGVPVANADSYTLQGALLTVPAVEGLLANDTDPNGDPLTAGKVGDPAHGEVTINSDGAFTYRPDPGFINGTDSFTYQVRDGVHYSAPATVTVTVVPPGGASPVANADSYTVQQGMTLSVPAPGLLANDTDADGDALQVDTVSVVHDGVLNTLNADGSFTYTPNPGFTGTDGFSYRISDGVHVSTSAFVTITVTPAPAPVVRDDSYTMLQDTTLTVAAPGVLGNDENVDFVKYWIFAASGTLVEDADGLGGFTYTPPPGFTGTVQFTYEAEDNLHIASASATVTITVTQAGPVVLLPANGAALAAGAVGTAYAETNISASGGVGAITFSAVDLPPGLAIDPVSGKISGTPTADGTFTPTVTATAATTGLATASYTIVISPPDNTPPTVTINQGAGQADPTSGSTITFDVVFSEPVTGFGAGDVVILSTAGATNVTVVGSEGATYTVIVTDMSASGTVTATIPAGAAQDAASNLSLASTSTDNTVTWEADNTPPTVTINQAAGQADPTSGSTITFDVVFSEPVIGFGAGDVVISSTAGATNVTVAGSEGATYTVIVDGMTTSGTVTATIPAGAAQDAAGNLSLASTSTDNTVTWQMPPVDNTPPTVTINQDAGQADPTSDAAITFTVVFSEPVTGFDASDVLLSGTANATTATVSGSGTTYTVTVTGMSASGTVIATIPAGAAQDLASNPSQASTSTDNTVTWQIPPVDNVPPTVTIDQAAGQADPTSDAAITFDVVFSEPITGFDGSDVLLSGTANATTATVSGSGATYTITVTGMSVSGTVIATIPAGAAQDLASNPNQASTSTDNTVTWKKPSTTPPISIADSYSVQQGATLTVAAPGILGNDSDPDGDVLSVHTNGDAQHGTLTVEADGAFTYQPAPEFTGLDSFTYSATDGLHPGNTVTVTITVTPALPVLAAVSPASGPVAGGTAVTITGAHLSGASAVMVGGVAATGLVVVGDGELTAIVPPHAAGAVDVSVATPGGTATLPAAFTYIAPGFAFVPPAGALPGATAGVHFAQAISVTGGSGPYAFSATGLPEGLSIDPRTGTIYGLPSMPGTHSVTVTVRDRDGLTGSATYSLVVGGIVRPDPTDDPEVTGLINAQAQASERFATAQIDNFNDRLERLHDEMGQQQSFDIRVGVTGMTPQGSAMGYADPLPVADPAGLALGLPEAGQPAGSAPPPVDALFGDTAFWAGGFVNFGTAERGTIDLGHTLVGVSGGVDHRFAPDFVAGIGFGYGRDQTDIGDNGTQSTGQAFSTALYGSYHPAPFYLDGLLGISRLDFDSTRFVTATGDFATGSRDGTQVFGSLSAGYEYRDENLLFSPYGRLQAAFTQLDGFVETGAGPYNLAYGAQSFDMLAGALGLRAEYAVPMDWGVLTARGRLEYTHDFAGSSQASIGYADLGSLPYAFDLDAYLHDYLTLGLGLDARLDDGVTLSFDYQTALGFDGKAQTHTFGLRLVGKF